MRDRTRKIIFLAGANLLLATIGVFWIYHGNFWNDENWYYHGALLFSKGRIPYVDFFYHRLPLHVEAYGLLFKIFGASFITGRFISFFFFIGLVNLTAWLTYKLCGNFWAVLMSYLFFLSPLGFHGFTTNSTYSLNALLLILSGMVILFKAPLPLKIFLFMILNFLIYGNRYLVDYQTVFLVALGVFLSIQYRKDKRALLALTASYVIGLLYLFKYTLLFGDKNIFFDTVTFNITLEKAALQNGLPMAQSFWDRLMLFGKLRLTEFDNLYPVNVFCLFSTIFLLVRLRAARKSGTDWTADPRMTVLGYFLLVVVLNFTFYYRSVNDWPVTKLYVFPLMVIGSVWFVSEILKPLTAAGSLVMQRITLALLLVLSATHGLSVNDLYVARNYENSDIVDLIKVTKAIGRASGEKEGLLLSFTPALATGGIQNEPRLNMEMFSFRPDLDADAVAKLGLANENFLKEKIRSKGYLVIALSKERFFGDHNMGKVISPYRESLMATITENYSLFEVIPTGRFEGEFRIFIPKQS